MKGICLFFLLLAASTLFFLSPVHAQTPYAAYNTDRDGDGVPDVRDKCPDTDKTLERQELKVNVKGQDVFVKIEDFKAKFQKRRSRLSGEIGKRNREKKKILAPVTDKKGRVNEAKLTAEDKERIQKLDEEMEEIRNKLADMVYETELSVDGKMERIEVNIGVDEFGCLPDRDQDNVPDIVDKCPDNPGIPSYYGCNDRDGDGVLDHEDKCVEEPGLKRLQGCPDRGDGDRDKDGTIDRDDLCPDTPGPKRNKGCPEIVSKEEQEIINQASKVLFDSGKATLRPESLSILDKLATIILSKIDKYQNLRVRLEGHTDSIGSDADNLQLSRNRSRSVKEYLVTKGIDVMIISTSGYGEERLKVKPERTGADRQANRRVEIAITNQD